MAKFDLAVVGAGAAGLSVAAVASQLGLRVALIERHRMGGDCLNTGCVPSKALLAAAHAAQEIREAGRYGIHAPGLQIDWAQVQAHVHGAIAAIAPMDSVARYTALGVDVMLGTARFIGADALEVAMPHGTRRLTARRIVIAAGGRAAIPDIPGLGTLPTVTHETIFTLPSPPDHLVILGGGPIGLEMAQAHAGLGCRVTVVQRRGLAPREDPELVAGLRTVLEDQGVVFHEDTSIRRVTPHGVELENGLQIPASHLLVAAGRVPNVEGLNLPAAGVDATPQGIVTDAGLRSPTNHRVFAVGDIADPIGIGPRHFTHVGSYHAGIIVRRALFRLPAKIDYAALPRVTFTSPELAQVGMTETEARAAGHQTLAILRWPLAENDRAQAEGRTHGLVKLVARRDGRLLGAGILAPHAGEMIGTYTLAIARRLKLSDLAGMIVPYPTLAEIGKRAAGTYFTPKLFSRTTRWIVRQLSRLP